MDPRTFVEMTEGMMRAEGRFVVVTLDGPACMVELTCFHRTMEYALDMYTKMNGRIDRMLLCNFVRAEAEGPNRVRLISRYGDRCDMPVFDPELLKLKEWRTCPRAAGDSSMIVEHSTIVEQGKAMAHG